MNTQRQSNEYIIILPTLGKGKKEIDSLFKRRKKQLIKAINKLRTDPIDFNQKGIEKIKDSRFGQYTIRISKGDRLFYDVNTTKKEVYLLRAGKHDYYKLM